jgi:hypothetical protein
VYLSRSAARLEDRVDLFAGGVWLDNLHLSFDLLLDVRLVLRLRVLVLL